MNTSIAPQPGDRIDAASTWCLRLAEGRLPPEVQTEFDDWLAADPENVRAFEDTTRTWLALEQARQSPELIEMRRSALDAFRRSHASQWTRNNSRRRRSFVAIAAGLLVVAVGAGLWIRFVPRTYETGLGERQVVALADGSKVSLDAFSRVDVRYVGDRRALWLKRGRAKFQVAKDPLRPFSVIADDKVVVATGTEFSVELLSSQVHVILYQGSVEVLAAQPGQALRPLRLAPTLEASANGAKTLAPGRELIATFASPLAQVKVVDPVRSLAWEAGQLAFSDEPLSSAVERMNRYADTPLAIGDAAAGRVLISGVFAAGDTTAFIEGVTGIFPVRVTQTAGRQSFVSAQ